MVHFRQIFLSKVQSKCLLNVVLSICLIINVDMKDLNNQSYPHKK